MEKETKTINYNELFNRSVIINAIPLGGITGKALCDIIMLQVDYGKAVDAFNSRMEDGLKKLKEEKYPKFDEESAKPEEERCAEYKEWLAELEKLYGEMRSDAAVKPVEGAVACLTRDILTAVCETGAEGNVLLPGGTDKNPNLMPKAMMLRILAEMVDE